MEFCFGNQRFKAAQLAAELIYVVLIDKQVLSGSEAVMHPKIAVPIADLSHDCQRDSIENKQLFDVGDQLSAMIILSCLGYRLDIALLTL